MSASQTNQQLGLWELIRADVRSTIDGYGKDESSIRREMVMKVIFSEKVHAVIRFRIGHALYVRGLGPVAMLLRRRTIHKCGAELHPGATVGPGFCLVHTVGVSIGSETVIGANCRLHHGSLIGESARGSRRPMQQPTVGDDVTVGAHSIIAGAITIGDGAVIGANTVVVKDVAAHTVVGGVPAKFIRTTEDSFRR